MANARLFFQVPFTLPASGAASSSTALSVANFVGGPYLGFYAPVYQAPTNSGPAQGISLDSNVTILRYRYSFLGAKGLRPSPQTALINGCHVNFSRETGAGTSAPNADLFLPFIASEEWIDTNIPSIIVPFFLVTQKTPFVEVGDSIYYDSRNLQTPYYGQAATMTVEIDVQANTTF